MTGFLRWLHWNTVEVATVLSVVSYLGALTLPNLLP